MRSALYYPHTEIRSEGLLKTALLLWDEILVIAPTNDYRPAYSNHDHAEAFQLIGRCHVPTAEEQKDAHGIIEDIVTRPLPASFSLQTEDTPFTDVFQIYPQKLSQDTWNMLEKLQYVGAPLRDHDYSATPAMGLTILNVLADCCAKSSFNRVTDRADSYASLQALMVSTSDAGAQVAVDELVPLAVKVVDADKLSFSALLQFRSNEGAAGRDLRHRFQDKISEQAQIVSKCTSAGERREALRQFDSDSKDDHELLREALKLKFWQTLYSKEILTSIIGAAGMALAIGLTGTITMPGLFDSAGGLFTIGGLLSAKSKFASERQKLLQEHPTAYLYEAAGGLRL